VAVGGMRHRANAGAMLLKLCGLPGTHPSILSAQT
jgi:hypothetical protein